MACRKSHFFIGIITWLTRRYNSVLVYWLSLQLAPVRAGVDIHLQANRQLWCNLFHSGL